MIHVRAVVTIVAADDSEADAVWSHLNELTQAWPGTPVIGITETERRVEADR